MRNESLILRYTPWSCSYTQDIWSRYHSQTDFWQRDLRGCGSQVETLTEPNEGFYVLHLRGTRLSRGYQSGNNIISWFFSGWLMIHNFIIIHFLLVVKDYFTKLVTATCLMKLDLYINNKRETLTLKGFIKYSFSVFVFYYFVFYYTPFGITATEWQNSSTGLH